MGREVRRVPLDFDAPLNQPWSGFVRPEALDGTPCPDCAGGQTHGAWWLQRMCQRLQMLADDVEQQQLGHPLHPWIAGDPYPHGHHLDGGRRFQIDRPTPDLVELVDALRGDRGHGYGLFRGVVNAAGVPEGWGQCTTCDGEGSTEAYPGQRADAESWERTDPPAGDGWQLWETVSDGGPISPVFGSAGQLADWMASPLYRTPITRAQAERFIEVGSAPTFVVGPGGLLDGENAVG